MLRRNAELLDSKCLVAQRIKRLSSIDLKLRLLPKLRLSQMQDIGGCRAIVKNVHAVNELVRSYNSQHKLDHIDDYIQSPKQSGYRGIHLIYRLLQQKNVAYNGLKVEIQLRSALQHAWATAVETVGTFISKP
ncbi:MAG: RelA/SpoT domain-containing protein [Nitrospiraceae bacterium]